MVARRQNRSQIIAIYPLPSPPFITNANVVLLSLIHLSGRLFRAAEGVWKSGIGKYANRQTLAKRSWRKTILAGTKRIFSVVERFRQEQIQSFPSQNNPGSDKKDSRSSKPILAAPKRFSQPQNNCGCHCGRSLMATIRGNVVVLVFAHERSTIATQRRLPMRINAIVVFDGSSLMP